MKLIILALLCASVAFSNAAIWEFDLGGRAGSGLNGGNVVDTLPDSFASGGELADHVADGIFYDDAQNLLEFHVGWGSHGAINGTDLRGIYLSSGLFGPATIDQNGVGPLYSFSSSNGYLPQNDPSGRTAFIHAQVQLIDLPNYSIAQQEADLLGSRFYFSVASSVFENGEIRGQLLRVIPEPKHYALVVGLVALGWAVTRRSRGIESQAR